MEDETFFALALSLTPGVGKRLLLRLIHEAEKPSAVLRMSSGRLKRLGVSQEARASLLSGRSLKAAEEEAARAKADGIQLVGLQQDSYPPLLRQIHDPPAMLYVRGDSTILRRPSVALVGSRRCTVYGREITLKLARDLAQTGLTIVSGMARGVDSKAHQGALEVNGSTAAVLGCGVDVVYPRENKRIYRQLCDRGCVISEFPIGVYPAPQNFPVRNRIISGLCYGTVISEAAEFSGSLITARLTLEQDRELWAVPGNVTSRGSYGPNYLIKQGASVVMEAQDVIDDLPLAALDQLARKKPESPDSQTAAASESVEPEEKRLLGMLPVDQSVHFDSLLDSAGMQLLELNQALLSLEMKGLIRQLPGRRFSRRLL